VPSSDSTGNKVLVGQKNATDIAQDAVPHAHLRLKARNHECRVPPQVDITKVEAAGKKLEARGQGCAFVELFDAQMDKQEPAQNLGLQCVLRQ
jgi:hypothetical protein